jgi:hypothetical protein
VKRRGRAGGPHPWRWLALLLPFALVFGVLARGHTLQSLGFEIHCDDAPGARIEAVDGCDELGLGGHDDCPSDCSKCPCGQIPSLPISPFAWDILPPTAGELLPFVEASAACGPPSLRLDRPPRATPI